MMNEPAPDELETWQAGIAKQFKDWLHSLPPPIPNQKQTPNAETYGKTN